MRILDDYFKNISCFGTTVAISITRVDGDTCKLTFDISEINVERLYLFVACTDNCIIFEIKLKSTFLLFLSTVRI